MTVETRACTTPPWVENPYRLVSLGEIVERFRAHRFIQAANAAGFGRGAMQVFNKVTKNADERFAEMELGEEMRERLGTNHKELRETLAALGLTASLKTIDRILALASDPDASLGGYTELAEELNGRLVDEMSGILFLSIAPHAAKYYQERHLFGNEVAEQFPSATFDIEEAGKCLALDRGTACVFHLMRALEVGLYAMASQFNIAPEENWHNAIKQIQSAVNRLAEMEVSNKSPWKKVWKDQIGFYEEAALQFMYFKEPWRNRTAHAGKVYTSEKARSIFDHVCEFTKHLATRLSE